MAAGTARRAWANDADELADIISKLKVPEAISLGTLDTNLHDYCRVVTLRRLNGGGRPDVIARSRDYINFRDGQRGFTLLDDDPKTMPPDITQKIQQIGGWWNVLVKIVPEIAQTACVERLSTSAGLYRTDTNEDVQGSDGRHLYLCVENAADSERFLKALHQRCWLAGLGWYWVDVAGKLHERSPIDVSVWAPERLIYEAAPILDAPLAQHSNKREPIVYDGDWLDTQKTCPSLTTDEENRLKEIQEQARKALAGTCATVRKEYIENRSEELVKRAGISPKAAKKAIEKQCNGILLPSIVLPFDDVELDGKTVGDVLANPKMFIGETLADPVDPTYGTSSIVRGKAKILRRPDRTVFVNSFAHGGASYELVEESPEEPPSDDDGQGTLAQLNLIYATVSVAGKFRVMTYVPHREFPQQREPVFSTKTDFLNHVVTPKVAVLIKDEDDEKTIKVARGKWWIENPEHRQFDDVDFLPGGPEVIEYTDTKAGRTIRKANMWSGFAIGPEKGNCGLYLAHVKDHVCQGNNRLYDYTLAWMASGVQMPQKPAKTSLTMRGIPGAGKGVFADEYGKLFGRHYLHLFQREQVTGKFNAHSAESCLIFADEALFVGDARDADILKALVSEETKMLERKGLDAIQVRNYARLIFASNHERVVRIDNGDRRYCAYHVVIPTDMAGARGADKRRDYFVPIIKQMENGGRAALLAMLLEMDVDKFNPEAIPETKELDRQKLLSAPPEVQMLIDLADNGVLPGVTGSDANVARSHLDNNRNGLLDYMRHNGGRTLEHASDVILSGILKEWEFEKKHFSDGNAWLAPELLNLREKLASQYPGIEWSNNKTKWGGAATERE